MFSARQCGVHTCSLRVRRIHCRSLVAMADSTAQGPVYVVVVTGKVKTGRIAEFKEYFKPLADHVTEHESGCLTYQLSVGSEDPDALCIYERYVSQEYLETVHWQSDAFKTFGGKVRGADLWDHKTVTKYWEEPPGAFGYHAK